ncbi:hypothetical protein FJT64_001158 [Amphibalanus amphitrite]|uniref:Uncharacterized protein n=1 Tax=Amphibalanus amphitrite TaxID=1232801 RepID=A0A6A4VDK7_AMPAM|nr:hypothetical protein FJT64_001158 [Amphibalanus amphitrite]
MKACVHRLSSLLLVAAVATATESAGSSLDGTTPFRFPANLEEAFRVDGTPGLGGRGFSKASDNDSSGYASGSGSTSGSTSGTTSGSGAVTGSEPASGRQYGDGHSQSYGTSWNNHYQSPTKGSSYDSRYDAPEKGDSNSNYKGRHGYRNYKTQQDPYQRYLPREDENDPYFRYASRENIQHSHESDVPPEVVDERLKGHQEHDLYGTRGTRRPTTVRRDKPRHAPNVKDDYDYYYDDNDGERPRYDGERRRTAGYGPGYDNDYGARREYDDRDYRDGPSDGAIADTLSDNARVIYRH